MGKWQQKYQQKYSITQEGVTDRTDKSPQNNLMSVLPVSDIEDSENNQSKVENSKASFQLTDKTAGSRPGFPVGSAPDKQTSLYKVDREQFLAGFLSLVRQIGADHSVRLSDAEILTEVDEEGIHDLMQARRELRLAWAQGVATRLVLMRGVVPGDWVKTLTCACCGPVYYYTGGERESCHWCHVRFAGKPFPQPEEV